MVSVVKINKLIAQGANLVTFSILLPFVYGCNGGGGGSASLGSLFTGGTGNPGGGGGGVGGLLNPGGSGSDGGGVAAVVGAVHQPEPTTMLLLGSGIAAMGLIYKKKQLGR